MPRHPSPLKRNILVVCSVPRQAACGLRRFGLSTGRRKLLVADDSPAVRKVISLTFEDEGVEVVSASNGAEALRILQTGPPPDVLLADVMMPGPDGYELCARVRSDPRLRHVPVVLLVGKFEPFNEGEARRVGADTVLTKPFQSIRDLVSKVGSLIGGEPKEADRGEEQADRGGRAAHQAAAERHEAGPQHQPSRPADEDMIDVMSDEVLPHGAEPPPYGVEPLGHQAEAYFSTDAGGEPEGRAPERFQADPASSFADLGADDELIEARPAEAFGARAHAAPQPEAASSRVVDTGGEESQGAQAFSARARQESAGFEPRPLPAAATHSRAGAPEAAGRATQAEAASREPQQAFAARAAAAATADDALLDLGGFGQSEPAATHMTEGDDFILDLDEDEPPPAAAQSSAAQSAAGATPSAGAPSAAFVESDLALDLGSDEAPNFPPATESGPSAAPFDASANIDEAGAFAEAAHGESVAAADVFEFDLGPRSAAESTAAHFAAESHDPAVAREVVAQDVPPQFESFDLRDDPLDFSGGASQKAEPEPFAAEAWRPESAAPRDFVEPTIVPAEDPTPGSFAGEFTDGSVEGDMPKPPASFAPAAELEGSNDIEAGGASAAETIEPPPSIPGPVVGRARAGVDERTSAGSLSAEDIEAIARRVVELISDKVIRDIAWEVVPELADLHVRRKLEEGRGQ
jgi:CheY-like chemotaxis protein